MFNELIELKTTDFDDNKEEKLLPSFNNYIFSHNIGGLGNQVIIIYRLQKQSFSFCFCFKLSSFASLYMIGLKSNRSVFYDINHKFGLSLEKETKNILPNFYSRIYNYVILN